MAKEFELANASNVKVDTLVVSPIYGQGKVIEVDDKSIMATVLFEREECNMRRVYSLNAELGQSTRFGNLLFVGEIALKPIYQCEFGLKLLIND